MYELILTILIVLRIDLNIINLHFHHKTHNYL